MLLRVESDNERRDVDDLLADSDVSLSDQDSGVVDRLGKSVMSMLRRVMNGATHPSLKTWVCNRRSRKSSVLRAST